MHYLIALIYFLLALVGLDGYGSHTLVTRSAVNGVDVLYSRTHVAAGIAEVACISSESGRCHYRVMPADCTAPRPLAVAAALCNIEPHLSFVLSAGARRQLAGLPASFTLCVSQNSDHQVADCESIPTQL